MAQLHNIGSYYCEICDISLKTKDSYKYHKTKHNPKVNKKNKRNLNGEKLIT